MDDPTHLKEKAEDVYLELKNEQASKVMLIQIGEIIKSLKNELVLIKNQNLELIDKILNKEMDFLWNLPRSVNISKFKYENKARAYFQAYTSWLEKRNKSKFRIVEGPINKPTKYSWPPCTIAKGSIGLSRLFPWPKGIVEKLGSYLGSWQTLCNGNISALTKIEKLGRELAQDLNNGLIYYSLTGNPHSRSNLL